MIAAGKREQKAILRDIRSAEDRVAEAEEELDDLYAGLAELEKPAAADESYQFFHPEAAARSPAFMDTYDFFHPETL